MNDKKSIIFNHSGTNDKEERKDNGFYKKAVICGIVVALLSAIICMIYAYSEDSLDSDIWGKDYDEGWSVYHEDHSYENINLGDFQLPHILGTGDAVTITNTLPENIDEFGYEVIVLRFFSSNSIVSVSIDGKEVYSYGQARYEQGKMVGSGNHYVGISTEDAGKEISITYHPTEHHTFTSFRSISLFNGVKLYQYELVRGKIPFTVSILLIMLGFSIMLISIIVCVKRISFLDLFWVGCISMVMGAWSICYYGYAQVFNIPLYVISTIEYVASYVFAIPMLLYFKVYVDAIQNKKAVVIYRSLLGMQLFMDGLICYTHVMGMQHFPTWLPAMHVLMAVELVYVVVILFMNVKKGDASSKTILSGTLFMVLFIGFEYFVYAVRKYEGIHLTQMEGVAAIGTLVFIFVMITAFAMKVAENMKLATERAALYRMAYTDELTQLSNRRFCEKKMQELVEGNSTYAIINFDLNGLKEVNDTLGHHVGDSLLVGFADILRETFQEVGSVGRMGGDEFMAIIEGENAFQCEKHMERLMENIQKANGQESRFQYSTAYGYANNTEIPEGQQEAHKDSLFVYTLADSRMYANKRTYKTEEL